MIVRLDRILAIALLLLNTPAMAQIDADAATVLMRKSGLWQQLADVAPRVRAGITAAATEEDGLRASPTELDRLTRIVDAAFAPERLRSIAVRTLASGMQSAHLPRLLAWYGSATGAAITKLEEASVSDDGDSAALLDQGAALLAKLPPARRALIGELVDVSRSVEAITNMTINMALAVQAGLKSAQPSGTAISAADLRTALESQRPQMQKLFQTASLATFARIYASVSDEALAEYIAFLKTPAGSHYTEMSLRAVDAALVDAARELGRGMPGTRDSSNI